MVFCKIDGQLIQKNVLMLEELIFFLPSPTPDLLEDAIIPFLNLATEQCCC